MVRANKLLIGTARFRNVLLKDSEFKANFNKENVFRKTFSFLAAFFTNVKFFHVVSPKP